MKFNYLVKAAPLLGILVLMLFLSINNQKEYTKLRLLIWQTPSLTVGKYLAISTSTGFLLSYIITTYLANISQSPQKQSLKFKDISKQENNYESIENLNNQSYDTTLIERDIKDPSPTINANFRIIGKTDRIKEDTYINNNIQYEDPVEIEDQYDKQPYNIGTVNQKKSISADWDDYSFLSW